MGQGQSRGPEVSQAPAPLAAGEGAGFEANAAAYGNAFAQHMAFGGGSAAGGGTGDGAVGGFALAGSSFGQGECQGEQAPGGGAQGEEQPAGGGTPGGEEPRPATPRGKAPAADTRPPVPNKEASEDPMEPGAAFGVSWDLGGCSEQARREFEAMRGPPLEISVSNSYPDAATGGQWDRTTVGVGEEAIFGCEPSGGTWSATGGTGTANSDGNYEWQAPGTPGSVTITYEAEGRRGTLTMTVLAPVGITSTKTGALPTTRAGAGMGLDLTILPLTVSFANADWYEVPGAGIATGYFTRFPASDLAHDAAAGAGNWVNMGSDNRNVHDEAGITGWPAPWSHGVLLWPIPTHYRAAGGPSTLFHTEFQRMTVTDPAGNVTVSKYGQSE